MGRKKQRDPEIRERDVGGMKLLQKLLPLLERLHDEGCERDKAGNRQLHCDQYCLLSPAVSVQSDRQIVAVDPAGQ